MNRYSQLEERLKQAFKDAPEPPCSDDAAEKLAERIHAIPLSQPFASSNFDALDFALRNAFQRRDLAPLDGYDRAREALESAYSQASVLNLVGDSSPLSEASLTRAGQTLTRRLRALTAPREEEPEVVFAGMAFRFAAIALPCSLAIFAITLSSTSKTMDHRPVLALFGEVQSL